MRTETIQKTYLEFHELTDDQKEKVLDNLRDINVDDHFWYEPMQEDFHAILEILGYTDIKSQFTGFWSQGDGASFSADFLIPENKQELNDRLAKMTEYAPNFMPSTGLDKDFLALDFSEEIENEEEFVRIDRHGRYCHECTMYCDNDILQEFSRKLAKEYYYSLDKEYEFLTSDEAIIETIEANEYEFDSETLKIA